MAKGNFSNSFISTSMKIVCLFAGNIEHDIYLKYLRFIGVGWVGIIAVFALGVFDIFYFDSFILLIICCCVTFFFLWLIHLGFII
jgi:hypothetical protein